MNLALACCLSFGLGIVCTLACCWRRLSLAEHLREELQGLVDGGGRIRIREYADKEFWRRLTAAEELLKQIEERK